MELIHISGDTYYFNSPVTIGVIIRDNSAIMIDTGLDENAIRKALNTLKTKDITLKCVINTHSHADHIGGNYFVEARTGVSFYASATEAMFIKTPWLLPTFMFGARAVKELNTKFFLPRPTKNVKLINNLDENLHIIALPGHAFDMIGVGTEDNVYFIGDAVFSKSILDKHPLVFNIDTAQFLNTLNAINNLDVEYFVLSHKGVKHNIEPELNATQNKVTELLTIIEQHKKQTLDTIVNNVLQQHNIQSTAEYFLNRVPILAAISYLANTGRVKLHYSEGAILLK